MMFEVVEKVFVGSVWQYVKSGGIFCVVGICIVEVSCEFVIIYYYSVGLFFVVCFMCLVVEFLDGCFECYEVVLIGGVIFF